MTLSISESIDLDMFGKNNILTSYITNLRSDYDNFNAKLFYNVVLHRLSKFFVDVCFFIALYVIGIYFSVFERKNLKKKNNITLHIGNYAMLKSCQITLKSDLEMLYMLISKPPKAFWANVFVVQISKLIRIKEAQKARLDALFVDLDKPIGDSINFRQITSDELFHNRNAVSPYFI